MGIVHPNSIITGVLLIAITDAFVAAIESNATAVTAQIAAIVLDLHFGGQVLHWTGLVRADPTPQNRHA